MNNLGPETDIQTEENREKSSETASIPKETKAYSSMPPRYPQPPQYAIPPVQQQTPRTQGWHGHYGLCADCCWCTADYWKL